MVVIVGDNIYDFFHIYLDEKTIWGMCPTYINRQKIYVASTEQSAKERFEELISDIREASKPPIFDEVETL